MQLSNFTTGGCLVHRKPGKQWHNVHLFFAKIQLISNRELTIITTSPFVHLTATGRGHYSNNFQWGLLDLLYFPSLLPLRPSLSFTGTRLQKLAEQNATTQSAQKQLPTVKKPKQNQNTQNAKSYTTVLMKWQQTSLDLRE